jgi:hypothetical protein
VSWSKKATALNFIALWALAMSCSVARSIEVDPRCSKAADQLGCTCAVQFGGWVLANGDWWGGGPKGRTLRVFDVCMEEASKSGNRSAVLNRGGGRNLSGYAMPTMMSGR